MANANEVLVGLTAQNMFNLQSVVAIVTGGRSGIGLMISSTLMANGAKVYVIGQNQAALDKMTEKYNEGAAPGMGRMYGIQGDVRLKSEAARIAALIGEREPNGITVLFNNAGILIGTFSRASLSSSNPPTAAAFVKALFDDIPEETFTDVYNTNAVGPYWFTVAFLPLLEKWKWSPGGQRFAPQVIMTSSMNGWTKDAATSNFSFPYLFSKSALGHATASLAHELLPLGIRVNAIAPGFFATELAGGTTNELGVSSIPPDLELNFEVPASHAGGTRHDMGSLALFLVANWFVNGETVLIDGGTLLRHPSSF
ncbi:NAD-P-binding protein [Flammula alnicola]|nr:NAD-P-binding protein [Flammula alnicola]